MKLFGETLEKRASLCYTFRMKYAERSQGNAYYTFTSITGWAWNHGDSRDRIANLLSSEDEVDEGDLNSTLAEARNDVNKQLDQYEQEYSQWITNL